MNMLRFERATRRLARVPCKHSTWKPAVVNWAEVDVASMWPDWMDKESEHHQFEDATNAVVFALLLLVSGQSLTLQQMPRSFRLALARSVTYPPIVSSARANEEDVPSKSQVASYRHARCRRRASLSALRPCTTLSLSSLA